MFSCLLSPWSQLKFYTSHTRSLSKPFKLHTLPLTKCSSPLLSWLLLPSPLSWLLPPPTTLPTQLVSNCRLNFHNGPKWSQSNVDSLCGTPVKLEYPVGRGAHWDTQGLEPCGGWRQDGRLPYALGKSQASIHKPSMHDTYTSFIINACT